MTETIKFSLDGKEAEAAPGETIWQVARRQGTEIPHLCYRDAPDYRGDGNCRACMVEIDGEPRLSASCIRMPEPGMAVQSTSQRAQKARRMVFELLITDQKSLEGDLKTQAHALGVTESRFPAGPVVDKDSTHTAINV
ncbi:MAG: 2Fe-2S iron-sulfur cluster-binding protein, partial [Rhodospirillales bacterium]|nr:2Fe-2S iron-sulfur cluster-binding protein [Rhodospirillales bacterium]